MIRILRVGFFIFLLLASFRLEATHNRAGEITYEQIGELTIRATITTYTKTSSQAADRDSLEIFWGDGTSEYVLRSNGNGQPLANDIKVNKYVAEHSYPGRSTYTISMQDPNRVANILNINWPNSIDVPFFISTTFTFLNDQFQGNNNSAILLQPPIDIACVGQPFIHNPNAFDVDGDSLSYELVVPFEGDSMAVQDYMYPDQIVPGLNNVISLDERTGDFVWDGPQSVGEYNIAIRINEFRDGVLINSIIRDMQILVRNCMQNEPPSIETIEEICVVAGELIDLELIIDDPNAGQRVKLTALGGPLDLALSPAELIGGDEFKDPVYTARLIWQTQCEHISKEYYQIVLRAVDDHFGQSSGLATLKTIRIKVSGPRPENLDGVSVDGAIRLDWELPYVCEDAADDYFQGFSVWRKVRSQQILPDTCNPGLTGSSYEKIEYVTKQNDGLTYFYLDETAEKGKTYCYRVQAEFARTTSTGNPFNRVEGLESEEICLQLSRDLPLITNVSVINTNTSTGSIQVRWLNPLAADLDTIENPGPYRYQLLRAEEAGGVYLEINNANFVSNNFASLKDTSFVDTGLNTSAVQYFYKVDFYVNGNRYYGSSAEASSVYLTISPADQTNILTWTEQVPWDNYEYVIYRITDSGMQDSIGVTNEKTFSDRGLTNGEEYCYVIESVGTYGISKIRSPLLNLSNENCSIPVDINPPCPPTLTVGTLCDEIGENNPVEDLFNLLSWTNPNLTCEETDDVEGYNIYYSELSTDELTFLEYIDGANQNIFEHFLENNISGCYAISAIDTEGNESEQSNVICVDNCPFYKLPNVFTPNDDGSNDLYVPIVNRFIETVDFKVYNEWGNLVFETTEPNLNWDGKSSGGKDLAESVYFYTCRTFEKRVDGITQNSKILRGFVHIIRGE